MCGCRLASFYQYAGFLFLVICMTSFMLAFTCPYQRLCPTMFGLMMLVALMGGVQGCVMMNVGWAIGHVEKLKLEDLAATKITINTRRWGFIAKKFPIYSRWLFTAIGGALGFILIAAAAHCPSTGEEEMAQGQTLTCNFPPVSPQPVREATILFLLYFVLVMSGCRVRSAQVPFPFLYNPEAEKATETAAGACFKCALKVSKMCHP
eukprot:TRINITY_DN63720_c0_g1_i1.p1 TRINITY_DN63720_c0_g1~~TRINITY_DN63720_c0_g1_i1.p1  ORF type:complete len:207 (-),score=38.96 TRINITY_DN63720_c0_g1_i1:57-677(-)